MTSVTPRENATINFFKKSNTLFMKQVRSIGLLIMAVVAFEVSFAQEMMNEKTIEVGGAPMYPSKNIVENAVNSKDHTTLVAAVKAAGLVETLQSTGPFTVFAPTNAAFDMLPKGTVETLVRPENKSKLAGILTYHVVAGKLDSRGLDAAIKAGGELKTVAGGKLWISKKAGKYMLKDENGDWATITVKNVYQNNGVIHVIDRVLLPK
jgi:uncharacterized surface protein with fasciclin (FAS1) repeats